MPVLPAHDLLCSLRRPRPACAPGAMWRRSGPAALLAGLHAARQRSRCPPDGRAARRACSAAPPGAPADLDAGPGGPGAGTPGGPAAPGASEPHAAYAAQSREQSEAGARNAGAGPERGASAAGAGGAAAPVRAPLELGSNGRPPEAAASFSEAGAVPEGDLALEARRRAAGWPGAAEAEGEAPRDAGRAPDGSLLAEGAAQGAAREAVGQEGLGQREGEAADGRLRIAPDEPSGGPLAGADGARRRGAPANGRRGRGRRVRERGGMGLMPGGGGGRGRSGYQPDPGFLQELDALGDALDTWRGGAAAGAADVDDDDEGDREDAGSEEATEDEEDEDVDADADARGGEAAGSGADARAGAAAAVRPTPRRGA